MAADIRAGRAYVELFTRDARWNAGLTRAAARLKAFGAAVTAIGAQILSIGVLLAAPLLAATHLFSQMGSDMLDASQRTGMAVEALSELRFAATQSGASVEELETGLRNMQRQIAGAANGSNEAQQHFERLGLSWAQLAGMKPEDQFELLAEKIGQLPDAAQRSAAAMAIFGRSGTRLLPLMSQGAAGVRELREEARRLGITMSTEDAVAAEAFGDALSRAWAVVKSGVFAVGAALAPALQRVAGWFTEGAAAAGRWINANREIVQIVGAVVLGISAIGVALLLLGPAISALGFAVGLVGAVFTGLGVVMGIVKVVALAMWSAILGPVGLILVGVALLGAGLVAMATQSSGALTTLGSAIRSIGTIFGTTWQGIMDAIAVGDLAGAMEIAWLGLRTVFATGLNALRTAWRGFAEFFTDRWVGAQFTVSRMMSRLWAGAEAALWDTINAMVDIVDAGVVDMQIQAVRIVNVFDQEEADRQVENLMLGLEGRRTDRNNLREIPVEAGAAREAELTAQEDRERADRRRAIDAANALDLAEVNDLQNALNDRAAQLGENRRWADFNRMWDEAEFGGRRRPVESGMRQAEAKVDVAGTFSAAAVAGLGADSLAERTARATEKTAEGVDRLAREVGNGGAAFA